MNKAVRLGVLLLALALLAAWTTPVHAAPTLTQIQSQVTVLEDGRLQVKYRLTFVDDDSRTQITTMGPFDRGHSQIEAYLEHEGQQTPVGTGAPGRRQVPRRVRDHRPSPAAPTPSRSATWSTATWTRRPSTACPTASLAWAPPQWALPIDEQIVTFILPIELPADITEPEQVTDEIVNEARLFVERGRGQHVRPLDLLPHARRGQRQELAVAVRLQGGPAARVPHGRDRRLPARRLFHRHLYARTDALCPAGRVAHARAHRPPRQEIAHRPADWAGDRRRAAAGRRHRLWHHALGGPQAGPRGLRGARDRDRDL